MLSHPGRIGRLGQPSPVAGATSSIFSYDFRSSIPAGWTHAATDAAWFENASGLIEETNGTDPAFAYRNGQAIGVQLEPQGVELALHNRDLSDAVWTALSGTATKTATGADGVANSASVLTATGADASFSQTFVLGALARTITVRLRRVTGTGVIRVGDGTAATDVTSQLNTSTYVRVADIATALANPKVVIDIVTSGDVIEADFVDLEDGTFSTSDIPTGASQVTRPTRTLEDNDITDWMTGGTADGLLRVKCRFVASDDTEQRIYHLRDGSGGANQVTVRKMASGGNKDKLEFAALVSGGDLGRLYSDEVYTPGDHDIDIEYEINATRTAIRVNGGTVKTLANGAGGQVPTGMDRCFIARTSDGANYATMRGFELLSWQPGGTLP